MNWDRVVGSDGFRFAVSLVVGWLLLIWLLPFIAFFVVVGALVGVWFDAYSLRDGNKLLAALVLISGFAVFGVVDVLFFNFVVKSASDDALGVTVVHWLSFWVAVAGVVLFYFRTAYQGQQIDIQIRERIDERFNAAVTLLGSGETSARTGAIYSLYHLAVEDVKYRKEAAQILCSHIRSKTQEVGYQKEHKERPSNEIQTAIDLLFRDVNGIKGLYKNDAISIQLSKADLSHSYLAGANFKIAQCQDVNFQWVNFEKANFNWAECRNSIFQNAICSDVIFFEAQCQGVDFQDANCRGAKFEKVHCAGAYFARADCINAWFYQSDCRGTMFMYAKCQGAKFIRANCQGVLFWGACCQGALFVDSNCQGAIFYDARIQGADFTSAKCHGVKFKRVSCQGAIFNGANFQGAYSGGSQLIDFYFSIANIVMELSNRVGQNTELRNILFSGKFDSRSLQEIESAKEFLDRNWWYDMELIIEENKDKPLNFDIPEGVMITGVLEDSEEIRKIIMELGEIADGKS